MFLYWLSNLGMGGGSATAPTVYGTSAPHAATLLILTQPDPLFCTSRPDEAGLLGVVDPLLCTTDPRGATLIRPDNL